MPDELSIPDLLSLLQVDRTNSAIKLAIESERLCRRHRYEEAIAAAKNAVYMAGHKSGLQGVALLYLSTARFASAMPDECHKAIRDSARAIRALSVYTHNRAIAQIIRAKFETESDDMQVSAIEHLSAVANTLQALIADSWEYQRPKEAELYHYLLSFVEAKIGRLHFSLTAIDRAPSARPAQAASEPIEQSSTGPTQLHEIPQQVTTGRSQHDRIQGKLPIPTRLLWPIPEPTSVELFPIGNGARLDYIDASRLSVDGQPFSLEPVSPVSGHDEVVRLHAGKQYLAYQVEGNPDQRVLVRNQNRPDQLRQLVVVADPAEARVWIDDAESEPPYTHIHIWGLDRSWNTENHDQVKPHIIGVVEAIMTAIEPDQTP